MPVPFDPHVCQLGEGAFWHPERQAWFWLDILERKLFSREGDAAREWDLAENVGSFGWVDRDRLFMAGETAFWLFDIDSGDMRPLAPLEPRQPQDPRQ